ncbi:unnamed protein product [Blepharisma stoltei]|uniref:Transposase n=1 Tax=Blepharisma stoltei TaxID=1481888 RepID=A0AAU9IE26_9CILI|nr:unnamed protein product [Blepharisma stoltei]
MIWGRNFYRFWQNALHKEGEVCNQCPGLYQRHSPGLYWAYGDYTFVQDGATAHTARQTMEYCRENGIDVKTQSPKSPDLNPMRWSGPIWRGKWRKEGLTAKPD